MKKEILGADDRVANRSEKGGEEETGQQRGGRDGAAEGKPRVISQLCLKAGKSVLTKAGAPRITHSLVKDPGLRQELMGHVSCLKSACVWHGRGCAGLCSFAPHQTISLLQSISPCLWVHLLSILSSGA